MTAVTMTEQMATTTAEIDTTTVAALGERRGLVTSMCLAGGHRRYLDAGTGLLVHDNGSDWFARCCSVPIPSTKLAAHANSA